MPPKESAQGSDLSAHASSGSDCKHQSTQQDESFATCLKSLIQLLPSLARGLRRRRGSELPFDGADLGPRHGATLSLLRNNGQMTVGQLAQSLELTLGTVSGIVADIEKAGLAERSADPSDRRRIIVTLRQDQKVTVDTWLKDATGPMERTLERLTPIERESFLKGIKFLEAELNSPDSDRPAWANTGRRRSARRPSDVMHETK